MSGVLVLCSVTATVRLQAQTGLDAVLASLDASSKKFTGAQAQFRWDTYEKVVKATTTQNGWIYFKRTGSTIEMGAKVDPDGAPASTKPSKETPKGSRVLSYKDAQLQMFDPGQNQIDLLKAGKNQAQYESFLTLGFGGSGSDLKKVWNIAYQGPETIDGVVTQKLDLTYPHPSPNDLFTHITIWVDPTRAVSLKQVFYGGDNTKTSYYTHITVNQPVDTAAYAIVKDKSTKTVIH